jgi:CheY-like chemotaxis protein
MIRQVRGTRCLVVESNPLCAAAVKEVLLSLECSVKTVSSCREALRLLNVEATAKDLANTSPPVVGSPPASALSAGHTNTNDIIFIDSLRLAKEPKEMEAMMLTHPDKYFVLLTRITERGVLRINASNFSSLAKPIKRIPLLDCLVAFREREKEKRNAIKLNRTTTSGAHHQPATNAAAKAATTDDKGDLPTPLGHRRTSEEEAQEQGVSSELDSSGVATSDGEKNPSSPSLSTLSSLIGRGTDGEDEDVCHGQHASPTQQDKSDDCKRKECEGPISVARILHSIQSQTEGLSPGHSLREIDGASFLMAEVSSLAVHALHSWATIETSPH